MKALRKLASSFPLMPMLGALLAPLVVGAVLLFGTLDLWAAIVLAEESTSNIVDMRRSV